MGTSLTDRIEKGKELSRRTDTLQRQGRERARESPDKKLLRFEYGNLKMARLSRVSSVASRSCQVTFSGRCSEKDKGVPRAGEGVGVWPAQPCEAAVMTALHED